MKNTIKLLKNSNRSFTCICSICFPVVMGWTTNNGPIVHPLDNMGGGRDVAKLSHVGYSTVFFMATSEEGWLRQKEKMTPRGPGEAWS